MTGDIKVFAQNSTRIEDQTGMIYIDPYQMKDEPHDAAFILVTHEHYDHFSPKDIRKVACQDTIMIVPEKMAAKARKDAGFIGKVITVSPGEHRNIEGLEFETIPAYNDNKKYHPKSAGGIGYILNVAGKRIYIAGDTDATAEARAVRCDVAIVPVGGTYTMNAAEAAELINVIQPEIAIPTHYKSAAGKKSAGETFRENVKEPVRVELHI